MSVRLRPAPVPLTGRGPDRRLQLQLDAGTRILTDAERQLPDRDRRPVAGTVFDFRAARQLGDQQLDFAFTDLGRDGPAGPGCA